MAAKSRKPDAAAGRGRWSDAVTRSSDALDLEDAVFKKENARNIALSLKRSADASTRRKGTPYQSAMSMLTFYINRAGKNLPEHRRAVLEQAKVELRRVFGRFGGLSRLSCKGPVDLLNDQDPAVVAELVDAQR